MKHNHMPAWQRRAIYLCTAVLLCSGLAWLSVHHWGWPAWSRASVEGLPSPWEPWLMKAHGAAMMLMLFIVGRVSGTHVIRGWRLKLRRKGGAAMLGGIALLAFTGYSLYYLIPDEWRDVDGWVHAGIGMAWLIALLVHRRPLPGRA